MPGKPGQWPALEPLIGGSLNLKLIEQQFLEILRLGVDLLKQIGGIDSSIPVVVMSIDQARNGYRIADTTKAR